MTRTYRHLDGVAKYLVILIAITLCQTWSCGRWRDHDCEKRISAKIPIGAAAQLAEAELKNCGFKVTFDPVKRTYYADKIVPGSVTDQRTQVLVQLDEKGRVSAVQVTPSITAP